MFYLLFLLLFLIILGLISYISNNRDILSPWFILIMSFSLSVIVCMINIGRWKVDIYPVTILVVFLAALSFGIGEIVSRIISPLFFKLDSNKLIQKNRIRIKKNLTILLLAFMFITLFLYFKYIYSLSLLVGNASGSGEIFKYARYAVINTKYNTEVPYYLAHFLLISKSIAYVYIFSSIYNKVFFSKINLEYFFPILVYIAQISISTARIDFIRLITYILMLFFILWKKKTKWSRYMDLKIIVYSLSGIAVFLFLFRLLGLLTGKTDVRNLQDDISLYMGSSIVGLNTYLESPGKSEFFGKETLYNVYSILRSLNLTSVADYNTPLEFIYFSGFRTNIYTSFRRYIQDYSYLGMLFILFIQGLFYGGCVDKIKRTATSSINIMVFCSIFYPIVEAAIDEQFISNIFTLATLYQTIYICVFFHVIIKKKIYI